MRTENDKYEKVLRVLRKSVPALGSSEDIEREVIKRISRASQPKMFFSNVIDILFGWVYIGWVRRSFITISILLVIFFVYQQGAILKQINHLTSQLIVVEEETSFLPAFEIEKRLLLYRLSGREISPKTKTITEKQLNQLLESINELEIKYMDLINMIEEDSEIKRYIEKKLKENNGSEINL